MSQFVNYNKRGFTLPAGYKDLIDILELSRRRAEAHKASVSSRPLQIREEHFRTAGLGQIGRYVSMLLGSPAKLIVLRVTYRNDRDPVVLHRSESANSFAIILHASDAHREQAIRAFFAQQGIQPFQDCPTSEAGRPEEGRSLIYPLPLDASRATNLTAELLRGVYGLSDVAGLDFRYYELKPAA